MKGTFQTTTTVQHSMTSHPLPPAQLQIVQHLYRFRFLSSHQLHHLLKSNSSRLTNYHLKQLTTKKYIARHYTRTLGLGNQPAIYYLATGSVKHFENLGGFQKRALNRIPKERYRSKQFIARSSFIANFYLHVENDSCQTNQKLYFFTKTELLAHPYLIHPLSDAYFARTDPKGVTKRYFLELIDESSPRFALRRRIEQYNDYIDSGEFEAVTHHPFPTILFICPGIASLIYLKKHLERIYEDSSLDKTQVYLTTTENAFRGKWETIVIPEC